MKAYKYLILLLMPFVVSCFEDKGTYDYKEMGDILIENIPDVIEVLAGADRIVINPVIKSSLEGEIKDGNPNYEFICKFDRKAGETISGDPDNPWVILNPDGKISVDTLATFPSDSYIGWYVVRDIRTGLETYKTFDVNLTSPTYEGWMVLCNEGEENRVRMDMISRISADRIIPAYNIMEGLGLPENHNAKMMGFLPSRFSKGDNVYLFSETGGYVLNKETFKTDESWNYKNVNFIIPPEDNLVYWVALNSGSSLESSYWFGITSSGNAYAKTETVAGGAFESPINTSTRGGVPEYKVAPFVGISMARPGNGTTALFYDVDNKRFVGWTFSYTDAAQTLSPLADPENAKFSYRTGKDLVYMESTRFSNGVVYAILQDPSGERSVCAINAGGGEFVQEAYYAKINAPEFNQATKFAFHSQYPFMFYAVKNKVYLYDLGTGTNYLLDDVKLGENEEVTMLKFNLFQNPDLTFLADQSDEFLSKQYDLIVGSYDSSVAKDGGSLRFFKVDNSSHKVSVKEEYKGFAKIVDVLYRERRK